MISFKLLEQYLGNSNITLVLTKNDNIITVSLLPQPKIKDEAKSNLKPIMIKGTAEELDAQFHIAIQKPLDLVSGVIDNISEFEKSVEKLKLESKASEEVKKLKDKEVQENTKKGEKLVDKAKGLFDKKEYDKATKVLNDPLLLTLELESAKLLKEEIEKLNPSKLDIFQLVQDSENSIEEVVEEEEKELVIDEVEITEQVVETIVDLVEKESEIYGPESIKEIVKESPNVFIATVPKTEFEKVPILNQEEIESLYEEKDEEPTMKPNTNFNNEIEDLF